MLRELTSTPTRHALPAAAAPPLGKKSPIPVAMREEVATGAPARNAGGKAFRVTQAVPREACAVAAQPASSGAALLGDGLQDRLAVLDHDLEVDRLHAVLLHQLRHLLLEAGG